MEDQGVILKIQNCYSWLITNNEEIKSVLHKALRFRAKGYFHSKLYKQKIWDGYDEFFKKESGKFLTGLLPEVKLALKYKNINYKTIDDRNIPTFLVDKINENYLDQWSEGNNKILLHNYQVELTNQIIKYHRGIICAPTSAGKTFIMLSILKTIPENTPTLILANRKSLVEQNYKILSDWKFPRIGRLYDKYIEPNMFTCATIQSLHKIEKILPKIRVLIVDEIHEMMTKKSKKYYNKLSNASIRVAVSATPFKFGGKDKSQKYSVKGYFGPILKIQSESTEDGVLKTKKLQEAGKLSKAMCNFYTIDKPDGLKYDIYLDAVTRGIAQNYHLNKKISEISKELEGRTLIIVERLEHGDNLNYLIPSSLWVKGKDNLDTRKEVIQKLQENEGTCIAIATQGIFNSGIDVKIHNLINAAGGKADHQIIQRFGRGLRLAGDKEHLNYIDFIFKINEYLEDHSYERIKILKKEGHEIKIID